jgi:hypothetical protein
MDSLDMNIQPVLAMDLVTIAFAMIPGLRKAFDSLIAKIDDHDSIFNDRRRLDDEYDSSEQKKELKNTFIELLKDRIELAKDIKKFRQIYYYSPVELKDLVFETKTWFKAFNIMADRINTKLMKNYFTFKFAIVTYSSFATKLDDYMYNFSKANNCDASSELYKNKLQYVITWLDTKMTALEPKMIEHYHLFEYDDSTFERDIKEEWDNILDQYICIENESFDNSDVTFVDNPSEKDIKRMDYDRRSKNSHKHNKRRLIHV